LAAFDDTAILLIERSRFTGQQQQQQQQHTPLGIMAIVYYVFS
jgi:hypothetical protein